MSYKSLLTVVIGPTPESGPLEAAIHLARREDAHLDVLCLGIDVTDLSYIAGGPIVTVDRLSQERAQSDAEAAETIVQTRLGSEDIRWATERAAVLTMSAGALVAQRARFADLVILGRPYSEAAVPAAEAIAESAMFSARAPVLIVPDKGLDPTFSERIVVAWNDGDEALAAVRAAMPLLKRARLVNIASVEPGPRSAERSDPGGALSQMLARHGVHSEVSVLARTLPKISDVLVRHALDESAGLIVMGAYGHSRLREAILGGATRDMLENTEVPVLMAR